ncbi:MAG TPA: type II secretion system F family protein [Magnetospirillum sp.]|nr:type II secretion system F family protein [Magnetospirillum sp.]
MLANLIIAVAALAAFASVLALGLPLASRDQWAGRVKAIAGRRQELAANQRADLRSNGRRVELMKAVLGRLDLHDRLQARELKRRLAMAGWRHSSAPITYIFSQLVLPVVVALVALFYTSTLYAHLSVAGKAVIVMGAAGVGAYLPSLLLTNAIQKRQMAVARAFPDSLDLLVICVEAGLSVEGALGRVTDEMGDSAPALAEEIGLTAAELAFLSDRRQAWDNLAQRTGLPQVKSLATALIQAEKYGTPVGQALKVLAQANRDARMASAEKKAAALPAKLTVPMIVFFLPVLFLVIAGPAAIQVMGKM